MRRMMLFAGSAALLLAAFIAGTLYYQSERTDRAARTVSIDPSPLVRFHSPSVGSHEAKVHIVEFLDPACETCRRFHPFVKNLMTVNPQRIRLSIRYAPFHTGADQMVRILEAARRQNKYWEVLEALLESQPQWTPNHTAQLDLVWKPLEGLGLDLTKLKIDMNAPEIGSIIAQDLEDARTLKVIKTPEFFVNGKRLPSFGYNQLKTLVDQALAEAYR